MVGDSPSVKSAKVLIADTVEDLHNEDLNAAMLHFNLANQQLGPFGDRRPSESNIQNETSMQVSNQSFLPWESPERGLKIHYPSTWEVSEFMDVNITAIASFHPPQNGSINIENFYIEIITLPIPDLTLNETIQPTIENIKLFTSNFRLIESRSASLAGLPAHQIIYTKSFGNSGNLTDQVKDLQLWTVKNGKQYNFITPLPKVTFQNH